jgi:hypothetical protein
MSFKLWTEEETKILLDNYGKIKLSQLCDLLSGRTKRGISWQARKHKLYANRTITNRIPCNDNYFSAPNLENSYWAGLIAADGCILKNRNSVTLNQADVEVIKKFLHCTKSLVRPTCRKNRNNTCYACTLTSPQIIHDLKENFSIGRRKTYHLLPPENLSYENSLSFITGLLDGDGHISIVTTKPYKKIVRDIRFGILGTLEIVNWIKDILDNTLHICRRTDCRIPLYRIGTSCHKAERILYRLYDLPLEHLRLSRKWNKVKKWREEH